MELQKSSRKKHNLIIAVWKFLFCLLILWRHATIYNPSFNHARFNFGGGSIAIFFFFFIVSGFLMAQKALSYDRGSGSVGVATSKYILRKVFSFLPFIIVAVLCSMITGVLVNGGFLILRDYINSIFDILIIPQIFITHTRFVGVAWYISAMLVGMMLLYPIIVKYKRNCIYLVLPILVLFTFGFMNKMDNGSYAAADVLYFGFLPKGMLASIGGLSLGGLSYALVQKLNSVRFTMLARCLLSGLQVLVFGMVFYLVCTPKSHDYYDSVMVVMMFLGVTLSFAECNVLEKSINRRIAMFLEAVSLPMYLNQMWVMDILSRLKPGLDNYYVFALLATIATFAVSIVLLFVFKLIRIFEIGKKFSRIFVTHNL